MAVCTMRELMGLDMPKHEETASKTADEDKKSGPHFPFQFPKKLRVCLESKTRLKHPLLYFF
jgi:hypothetical protein